MFFLESFRKIDNVYLCQDVSTNSFIVIVKSSLIDVVVVKEIKVSIGRSECLAEFLFDLKVEILKIFFLTNFYFLDNRKNIFKFYLNLFVISF